MPLSAWRWRKMSQNLGVQWCVREITIKLDSQEVKLFWTDWEQSEGWLNFTFSHYCSSSILLDYSDCILKLCWLVCSVCEIVLWFFLWVLQVKKLLQALPKLLAELSPGVFFWIYHGGNFFFFAQQELLCNCNFCWMQCILCGFLVFWVFWGFF